jgi:hypothetical protein
MTLRWRKNKPETGLRRVVAGPRGSRLYLDNEIQVASVYAHRTGYATKGWYWVATANQAIGIAHRNTCDSIVATEAEAKAGAAAYIRAALQSVKPKGSA